MQRWSRKQSGFTIVELLIVIVVIGILAAITLISYNGIQNRAKVASIKSDVTSAVTTLENYKFNNATANGGEFYPGFTSTTDFTALNSAGIKASGGGAITSYIVLNNLSPAYYCLTISNGSFNYSVTSTQTSPIEGVCVTNLALGPEATAYSVIGGNWNNDRYTTYGTYTLGTNATDGPSGIATYARLTFNNTSTARSGRGFTMAGNTDTTGPQAGTTLVTADPSSSYMVSGWFRQTNVAAIEPVMITIRPANVSTWETAAAGGVSTALASGVWGRASTRIDTTAGTTRFAMYGNLTGSINGPSAGNDTLDATAMMITKGTTLYNYGDGNSPGWVWTGTPNASTSAGPVALSP